MTTAQYIGLYLLKNNFCYVHGLGNLVVKKKPASYDGQQLDAPVYEVLMTPGGSIDDNLANFIATHEQTSISKASNNLREFSIQSRADLNEGKDVEIPSIGKFISVNGVISFVTDPNIQYVPPSIPALRTASRVNDIPTFKTTVTDTAKGVDRFDENDPMPPSSINWGKVIILVLILAAMLAAGIFGYRYYQAQKENTPPADTTVIAPDLIPPMATDGVVTPIDTVTQPATMSSNGFNASNYKVVLSSYSNAAAAEKRLKFLKSNGNDVEAVMVDSNKHLVLMNIVNATADTTRVKDSLRRFFNPSGDVRIYR